MLQDGGEKVGWWVMAFTSKIDIPSADPPSSNSPPSAEVDKTLKKISGENK